MANSAAGVALIAPMSDMVGATDLRLGVGTEGAIKGDMGVEERLGLYADDGGARPGGP